MDILTILLLIAAGTLPLAKLGKSFYDHEFPGHNKDKSKFRPNRVFIVMPFSGRGMEVTYEVTKEECIKLGLYPERADQNTGSGFVIRDIITHIEQAEFLICDLTRARPNVYYELGFAHGIGNYASNILLIAKAGTTIHFDVSPLRVEYYGSTENLRSIVTSNLRRMIELTRKAN